MTHAMSFAVCVGMDAMRICIGVPPKKHTIKEIIAWMEAMQETISDQKEPKGMSTLKTDEDGCTLCPACGGTKWKAVKDPRLGPGVYEVRCYNCNGFGWIDQEHETRP